MSSLARGPALRIVLLAMLCASCLSASALGREPPRERLLERFQQARQAAHSESKEASPMRPGLNTLRIGQAGQAREALVYVPSRRFPGPMPLVVALHGGGGSAAYMADESRYGLNLKADSAGFVVVYPNGFSRFPGGRLATWNAGACCGAARDGQSDDVGFVREVVRAVKARVAVDEQRVYAVGMSNGGMMSYRLACEAADVFRAVASVAGTEAVLRCWPSQPVAVLHIHALDDDHVRYEGGAGPGAARDASKVTDFVSVPATVGNWARRLRCEGAPRTVLQHPGARCERYDSCMAGATVQLCVTQTGGHSWPGAREVRPGKPAASDALSANDTMWSFFESLGPR